MQITLIIMIALLTLCVTALVIRRQLDHQADRREMKRLRAMQPLHPARFSPTLVAHLPPPARKFLTFAIRPGTPLYTVAELKMTGLFALGDKHAPRYIPMTASQVLAAPQGFIWAMTGGHGLRALSGSDSARWTRFWLAGLLPVARFGGNRDHARAAFGRCAAESVFWTPAALLSAEVSWEAIDASTARFTMTHSALSQTVDIVVDEHGQPRQVSFQRWSNANPQGRYQQQPFGGILSDFREVEGFCLPMQVEAGNFFGIDDYFPFFIAKVTSIRFSQRSHQSARATPDGTSRSP